MLMQGATSLLLGRVLNHDYCGSIFLFDCIIIDL